MASAHLTARGNRAEKRGVHSLSSRLGLGPSLSISRDKASAHPSLCVSGRPSRSTMARDASTSVSDHRCPKLAPSNAMLPRALVLELECRDASGFANFESGSSERCSTDFYSLGSLSIGRAVVTQAVSIADGTCPAGTSIACAPHAGSSQFNLTLAALKWAHYALEDAISAAMRANFELTACQRELRRFVFATGAERVQRKSLRAVIAVLDRLCSESHARDKDACMTYGASERAFVKWKHCITGLRDGSGMIERRDPNGPSSLLSQHPLMSSVPLDAISSSDIANAVRDMDATDLHDIIDIVCDHSPVEESFSGYFLD